MTDPLRALNPVPKERVSKLPLDDELLWGVLATEFPRRRRRRARLAVALATVCVAGAVLLVAGGAGGGRSGTAWAAEAVEFAEASPLVLLDADGWRVDYADEFTAEQGHMSFRVGPSPEPQMRVVARLCPVNPTPERPACDPVPADTTKAELNWYAESFEKRTEGLRRIDLPAGVERPAPVEPAPVLGTMAHVEQGPGGTPGHRFFIARWEYEGRSLEFSAGATDAQAFAQMLASLQRVDTDTWLSAMPTTVIKATDQPATIQTMLRGIPLPDGFNVSQIGGEGLSKDRDQLGAAVTGTVTCEWFKQWRDGQRDGNTAAVDKATAALNSTKEWPILQQMVDTGEWPETIWEYVDQMPSGEWYHRPLAGAVNQGLGCERLGVNF